MQKPFDPADLVVRLKGQGLDLAEDAAKLLAVSVLDWVADSVVITENKFDDMAVALLPLVRDFVLKEIDKLDGAAG